MLKCITISRSNANTNSYNIHSSDMIRVHRCVRYDDNRDS